MNVKHHVYLLTYLRGQTQGYHIIDHQKNKRKKRGNIPGPKL